MKIVSKAKYFMAFSLLIIVAGIVVGLFSGGLNLGIDFTGGTKMTIEIGSEYKVEDVKAVLESYGAADSPVVKSGEGWTNAVIDLRDEGTDDEQATLRANILAGIQEQYPAAKDGGF